MPSILETSILSDSDDDESDKEFDALLNKGPTFTPHKAKAKQKPVLKPKAKVTPVPSAPLTQEEIDAKGEY